MRGWFEHGRRTGNGQHGEVEQLDLLKSAREHREILVDHDAHWRHRAVMRLEDRVQLLVQPEED